MKDWELEYKNWTPPIQFNSIQRYIKRLWNFIHWMSSVSCEYRYRRLKQRPTSRCCCCCWCRNKDDNEKWFYTTLMNLNVLCLPNVIFKQYKRSAKELSSAMVYRRWENIRISMYICRIYVRYTHTHAHAHTIICKC